MPSTNINNFDLSKLPEKFQNNWHIYLTLRNDARTAYAVSVADAAVPQFSDRNTTSSANHMAWCDAFDAASRDWAEVNPCASMWNTGDWPQNAAVFLGNKALDEARELMSGQ
ncbi:MAG: hypothetical protein QM762_08690 [Chryseolinea sp.]